MREKAIKLITFDDDDDDDDFAIKPINFSNLITNDNHRKVSQWDSENLGRQQEQK